MSENQPATVASRSPTTSSRAYLLLVIGVTIGLCAATIVFVRPRITRWLTIRDAYRNLSHEDNSERFEALRTLESNGENPDEALIALLTHSDERVRSSAADALARRRPVTDRTIDVFFAILESDSPDEAIEQAAPSLCYRHAEQATGPLTPTDQRMIVWLRQRLRSTDPYESGDAAFALAGFLHRDPKLMEPLMVYFKGAGIRDQVFIAHHIEKNAPAFRDEYVQVLLTGLSSGNVNAELMAKHFLKELQRKSDGFVAELEARRTMTSDPQEASQLDRAIELLKSPADDAK
ncbi:MAG: HEAT repeat domain-containing protein [Planctomycetaceae bacterium]